MKEIREIRKYFEVIENELTIYQNFENTAKAMFKEKFIALNLMIEKIDFSVFSLNLINVETEKHTKPTINMKI